MAENETTSLEQSDDRTRNPSTDFEPRDVNIRGLVLTGAALWLYQWNLLAWNAGS